jgi:hypothetical protein
MFLYFSHAHRLRLEKLSHLELSWGRSVKGVSTDFLNRFWIQVAVLEVKRPSRKRFGIEAAKPL